MESSVGNCSLNSLIVYLMAATSFVFMPIRYPKSYLLSRDIRDHFFVDI